MVVYIKRFVLTVAVLISVIILFSCFFTTPKSTPSTTSYTLKSYKNTVALYNGEEIIEVYGDIILNTLPPQDIQSLNNGILVSDKSQAQTYLEDFE